MDEADQLQIKSGYNASFSDLTPRCVDAVYLLASFIARLFVWPTERVSKVMAKAKFKHYIVWLILTKRLPRRRLSLSGAPERQASRAHSLGLQLNRNRPLAFREQSLSFFLAFSPQI